MSQALLSFASPCIYIPVETSEPGVTSGLLQLVNEMFFSLFLSHFQNQSISGGREGERGEEGKEGRREGGGGGRKRAGERERDGGDSGMPQIRQHIFAVI